MKKRILATLCLVAMLFTLVPAVGIGTYAAETYPVEVTSTVDESCVYGFDTLLTFTQNDLTKDYIWSLNYSSLYFNAVLEYYQKYEEEEVTLEELYDDYLGDTYYYNSMVSSSVVNVYNYLADAQSDVEVLGLNENDKLISVWVAEAPSSGYEVDIDTLIEMPCNIEYREGVTDNFILKDLVPIVGEKMPTSYSQPDGQFVAELKWQTYTIDKNWDYTYTDVDSTAVFEADKQYSVLVDIVLSSGLGQVSDEFYFYFSALNYYAYHRNNAYGDYDLRIRLGSPFISDENQIMAVRYALSGKTNFDVVGKFDGFWKQTTYDGDGYLTYIIEGGSSATRYNEGYQISVDKETVTSSGLKINLDYEFLNEGKVLKVLYKVENVGSQAITFSLGSGSDVQIGYSDGAIVVPFTDGSGFKMISTKESDKDSTGAYAQLNFWCQNAQGVTDTDHFWYGAYDDYYDNPDKGYLGSSAEFIGWDDDYRLAIFTPEEENRLSANDSENWISGKYLDSAISWSWTDRTIESGATQVYSVLFSIGGTDSENIVAGDFSNITTTTDTITYDGEFDFNVTGVKIGFKKDNLTVVDPANYVVDTTKKTITFTENAGLKSEMIVVVTLGTTDFNVRNTIKNKGPKTITVVDSGATYELGNLNSVVYFDGNGDVSENTTENFVSYDPTSGNIVISGAVADGLYIPEDLTIVSGRLTVKFNGTSYIDTVNAEFAMEFVGEGTLNTKNISTKDVIVIGGEIDVELGEETVVDFENITIPATYEVLGGEINKNGKAVIESGAVTYIIRHKTAGVVTFDSVGGTKIDAENVKFGEKLTKPADPVRDSSEFIGWYLGNEKYDFDTVVTCDMKLTAHWILKENNSSSVVIPTEFDENDTKTEVQVIGETDMKAAGLDELAADVKKDETSSSVKIVLNLKNVEEGEADASAVSAIKASATEKDVDFLEIDITKYINEIEAGKITDTGDNVIEIILPYDVTGKTGITVYRYHDNEVNVFVEDKTEKDGTFYIEDNVIHIFTSKYSTYAVGFDKAQNPATGDTGLTIWASLMAVATLGIVVVARAKRRED